MDQEIIIYVYTIIQWLIQKFQSGFSMRAGISPHFEKVMIGNDLTISMFWYFPLYIVIDFNTLIVNTYQKIADWFQKKRPWSEHYFFQWGLGNRSTKRGHLHRPSPSHPYVTGSPLRGEKDGGTASSEWEICLFLYIKHANQICW